MQQQQYRSAAQLKKLSTGMSMVAVKNCTMNWAKSLTLKVCCQVTRVRNLVVGSATKSTQPLTSTV
jgi:hypothetical protein